MKELTKQEIFEFFESQEKAQYKKQGRFLSRLACHGESILTIVDGKLETIKVATSDDVVIKNIEIGSSCETYIISKQKFLDRYEESSERHIIDGQPWFVATAKGLIEACPFNGYTPVDLSLTSIAYVQFMAPWGELMLCNRGDFLARPLGGDAQDIYRIEQKTFDLTYKPV